jgi:hypothetical protein
MQQQTAQRLVGALQTESVTMEMGLSELNE